MAFVSAPFLPVSLTRAQRMCRVSRPLFAMSTTPPPSSGTPDPSPSSTSSTGYGLDTDGYELDPEALKEKAMEVVSDVGSRPLFYGKIAGYALGGLVTITILRAVVAAVDSLPVLPGALELVGLGYTAWFVWRYVLFKESREELLEEVEDFLGKAKPGEGP